MTNTDLALSELIANIWPVIDRLRIEGRDEEIADYLEKVTDKAGEVLIQ